ncbi:MAG TPA: ABC transporter permease, partial [Candidatus Krumholzibacterium sp.]|nr:ABC transporter permease [Candidatus Krumholzibacterium sp.]
LKVTFRNMMRHKGFTLINIVGLAMGITVCLVIILFVKNEVSSDGFHAKRDRIVRVVTTDTDIRYSYIQGRATSPAALGPALEAEFPGVENSVRFWSLYGNVMEDNKAVPVRGFYVEPSLFEIFDFTLRYGDPSTAFSEPYSVVLTRASAERFFGDQDPMGRIVELESSGQFRVTGVMEDPPIKSHIRFDILASFATLDDLASRGLLYYSPDDWNSVHTCYNYLLLEDGSYGPELERQLPVMASRLFPDGERERFGFLVQPLAKINLGWNLINCMPGTKHSMEIVFVPFVAAIILALACFNYVNLSVARSLKRAREIGLRKVIGADRGQVIRMFLGESLLITLISLVVACLLVAWLVPLYNGMDIIVQSKSLVNIDLMKDAAIYLWFLLFAVVVSLVAGLYPALYLSSFKPVEALKGITGIRTSRKYILRKILIGSQFGVTLIAIVTIILFQRQFAFMQSADKGFRFEDCASLQLRDVDYGSIRDELLRSSDITGVSASTGLPGHDGSWWTEIVDIESGRELKAYYYAMDEHFIGDMGLEIVAGRGFSLDHPTDRETSMMINEKAVAQLGCGDPSEAVGRRIGSGEREYVVIGVLRDFNYDDIENPINPLYVLDRPEHFICANITFTPGSKESVREYAAAVWDGFDPVHKANLRFVSDVAEEMGVMIDEVIRLASAGCGMIILIALLGLLGMTSHSMELRMKEIGVRKVLGAGVLRLIRELNADMLVVISISTGAAVPLAYLLNMAIFQNFPSRIDLGADVFMIGVVTVMALSLLTITSQTVRAALADPVDTLRDE